ncbi:stage VI sporulation protein D [Bacillus sp. MUM 13]|uniref:stage VI sporulation protein D n=1 Tax=Bacillus sp. MUM 13 TaxID=1678001 RepID=UPI0008F5D6CD|nr:stage VI sporulation protein D [Bacillus sp. MUM 13]OIK14360.1 stage VI sporulation protein D [Bacillus sp. MUM 13]
MTRENQSSLRFSLEESIWFQKGQEVAELYSISLDPNVSIQENDQYVVIKGTLDLSGEYRNEVRSGESVIRDYTQKNYPKTIHNVEKRENGNSEFSHRFPVDITIPANRISSLSEIDVSILSFDYSLPDKNCLKLQADLLISGIYNEAQVSTSTADRFEEDSTAEEDEDYYSYAGAEETEEIEETEIYSDVPRAEEKAADDENTDYYPYYAETEHHRNDEEIEDDPHFTLPVETEESGQYSWYTQEETVTAPVDGEEADAFAGYRNDPAFDPYTEAEEETEIYFQYEEEPSSDPEINEPKMDYEQPPNESYGNDVFQNSLYRADEEPGHYPDSGGDEEPRQNLSYSEYEEEPGQNLSYSEYEEEPRQNLSPSEYEEEAEQSLSPSEYEEEEELYRPFSVEVTKPAEAEEESQPILIKEEQQAPVFEIPVLPYESGAPDSIPEEILRINENKQDEKPARAEKLPTPLLELARRREAPPKKNAGKAEKQEQAETEKRVSLTDFLGRKQEEELTKVKVCIVQYGETLDTLADRYDVSVQSLLNSNELEPNQDIFEGQVLYIPKTPNFKR